MKGYYLIRVCEYSNTLTFYRTFHEQDLVGAPGSRVVVTMDHCAKDGSPKTVDECSLPLTGHNVVDRIITDMGVFDCDKHGGTGLTLVEIAPGITVEDVKAATGCDFKVVSEPIPLMDDA